MVAHNVIRILGGLPGGEVWSVTPKYYAGDGGLVTSYEDLLSWATAIAALNSGNVLPTSLRTALSTSATVTGVRAEYMGTDNRLAQAAEVTLPVPVPGQGTPTKPFQTAVVTSLRTGRPGRSARGRLYWPALGIVIQGPTLRLAESTRNTLCQETVDFLHDVGLSAPGATNPVLSVVSQTTDSALGVTQISVGDVLDTQRRRRDSLLEQYVTLPYP